MFPLPFPTSFASHSLLSLSFRLKTTFGRASVMRFAVEPHSRSQPHLFEVSEVGRLPLHDGAHSAQSRLFQLLTSIQRISVFQQSDVIFGDVVHHVPEGKCRLSTCARACVFAFAHESNRMQRIKGKVWVNLEKDRKKTSKRAQSK